MNHVQCNPLLSHCRSSRYCPRITFDNDDVKVCSEKQAGNEKAISCHIRLNLARTLLAMYKVRYCVQASVVVVSVVVVVVVVVARPMPIHSFIMNMSSTNTSKSSH